MFFMCSSVSGRLAAPTFWTCFCEHGCMGTSLRLRGAHSEVEWLDPVVLLCLVFEAALRCVTQRPQHFTSPSAVCWLRLLHTLLSACDFLFPESSRPRDARRCFAAVLACLPLTSFTGSLPFLTPWERCLLTPPAQCSPGRWSAGC